MATNVVNMETPSLSLIIISIKIPIRYVNKTTKITSLRYPLPSRLNAEFKPIIFCIILPFKLKIGYKSNMLPIRPNKSTDFPSEDPSRKGYVMLRITVSRNFVEKIRTLNSIMMIPITFKRFNPIFRSNISPNLLRRLK